MKKYIIIFVSLLMMASCSNEIATSGESSEKAILKLSLSAEPNINSRSINAAADNAIYDCTILTFNSNGNLSGKGYQTVAGGLSKFDMQIALSTNKGETCTVYAIANTNNPNLFDSIQTKDDFLDLVVFFSSPEAYAAGNISIGGTELTTNGQLMVSDGVDVQITDGVVPFKLKLYSQSAKLNFTINNPLGDAINGHKIKGYKLCHVPLSGYLYNKYKNANVNTSYSTPNGTYADFPAVNVTGDSTAVHFTYYMNENRMGVETENPITVETDRTAEHAPDNATYLEVYVVSNASHKSGTYRFYLGNMVDNINHSYINNYNVLRGYNYDVTINLNDMDIADSRFTMEPSAVIGDFLFSDGTWGSIENNPSKTPVAIIFSSETSDNDQVAGYTHGYAMALKNVHNGDNIGEYEWQSNDDEDLLDIGVIPNLEITPWGILAADLDGRTYTSYINSPVFPAGYAAATTYASQVAPPTGTSGWFLPSIGHWYWILVNLCELPEELPDDYGWSFIYNSDHIDFVNDAIDKLNNKLSVVGSDNCDAFNLDDEYGIYWSSSEGEEWTFSAYEFNCSAGLYYDYLSFHGYARYKLETHYVRPVIAF